MSNNLRRLTHHDYTVAWICALPCELTASLAVLDELHATLDNPHGDDNIYCYGEISGHNVVLTCLPAGVYGTISAARVGEQLSRTFESITVPLMVGIGGGVPNRVNDIRLGDVVVSVPISTPACPAVVQYDLGKVVSDGSFIRSGYLNKPPKILLAAVSRIQSAHTLGASQIPVIVAKALQNKNLRNQGFGYPGSNKDQLFEISCKHMDGYEECIDCGPGKQVERTPRSSKSPLVFYGPIASGNAVIKNSRIRDDIAQPLGILCFEMEAAGLMDTLPCLVIRGICDYCDSRKSKAFQNYSALVAAAFAKELLTVIPKTCSPTSKADSVAQEILVAADERRKRQRNIESLRVEEAENRLMAIRPAHSDTCAWLLSDPTYLKWLNNASLRNHHGVLWIKGKPGAGKSTLMKYALKHINSTYTVLFFFFNARGNTELEKSTFGLYRSLLYQLLESNDKLKESLKWLTQQHHKQRWTLEFLQNEFVSAVELNGNKPLVCFIDALDESSEDQIRDMMEIFKRLGALTAKKKLRFRVCYASRHYPRISIKPGLEIKLDEAKGHWQDLENYIRAELETDASKYYKDLKLDLLSRSAGIFLWIILAVRILKHELDHGRVHNLQNRLQQIPPKLNDLFQSIILKDTENLDQLLICLQLLLYTTRSLTPEEFYLAMLASNPLHNTKICGSLDVAPKDINNYILSVSKGLVETTPASDSRVQFEGLDVSWQTGWMSAGSYDSKVQFIHESVREFLLQPKFMVEIWSGFQALSPGPGHNQLVICCQQYLERIEIFEVDFSSMFDEPLRLTSLLQDVVLNVLQNGDPAETSVLFRQSDFPYIRTRLQATFPFIEYAIRNVLQHGEKAASHGFSQQNLMASAMLHRWLYCDAILTCYRDGYSLDEFIIGLLTSLEFYELLKIYLPQIAISDRQEILEHLMKTALAMDRTRILELLITAGLNVNGHLNNRSYLRNATLYGNTEAISILMTAGAYDTQFTETQLLAMASNIECSQRDWFSYDNDIREAFQWSNTSAPETIDDAIRKRHKGCQSALIAFGADVDVRDVQIAGTRIWQNTVTKVNKILKSGRE